MNNWLISVTAIIILTAVAQLILPDGKTKKLIKSMFSVIALFVLIMPLQQIKNGNFNVDTVFNEDSSYNIDYSFINFMNESKASMRAYECQILLKNNGLENVGIEISFKADEKTFIIDKVFVNIEDLVILNNNQHINISVQIMNLLADYLNIETERVILYE